MTLAPATTAAGPASAPQPAPLTPIQQFRQRRLDDYRRLELLVNNGQMTPIQAHQELVRRGYLPGGSAYVEPHGVLGLAAKTIGQTAATFAYAPKGVYDVGRAFALDERDAINHLRSPDEPYDGAQRLKQIARQSAYSIRDDFAHPLRNPGYALMDGVSLALLGSGLAARAASAGRAIATAREAGTLGPGTVARVAARTAADTLIGGRPGSPARVYRTSRKAGVARPVALAEAARQLPWPRDARLQMGLAMRLSKAGRRELTYQQAQQAQQAQTAVPGALSILLDARR